MKRVPLRFAASLNRQLLPDTTDPDLRFRYVDISAVDSTGRVALPDELMTFAGAPSRARRVAPAGATARSTVRTYLRAIARVPEASAPLVLSTGFAVAEATSGYDPRFLYYTCRSDPFVDEVVARSVGVSYPAINPGDLAAIPIPSPTTEAQRRIADFLDDQIARVDNIIAARRSQIDLIDSQRVCELDPLINDNERPAARLALFAHIQSGITVDAGRESVDGIDVPYLRVANVQAGALNLDEVKSIRVARSQVSRYLLRHGDVLMTEGGDIDKLGRGTVWRSQVPHAIHQNHVFAVRVDQSRLIPEYLAYVTASSPARDYFELTGNRTTNLASTSATKVLDLRIPVRSVGEQARVIEAAEEADGRARAGTGLLLDSIARLEELKRSLITAAVTGEFDVSTTDASQVLP